LSRPNLLRYADVFEPPAGASHRGVTVTFLGVATLLIDDGEHAIMTDGFFTRPSKRAVFAGTIAPDRQLIAACLARARVDRLSSVVCAHSHYDHALDSPVVADLTGASVLGSESTANICRGYGLAEDRITVVTEGESLSIGPFTITMLAAQHSPNAHFQGDIPKPFTPPARASAWAMGECYSTFIEYDGQTMLVQASANFVPGALAHRSADTVYLGVTPIGRLGGDFHRGLWREVVSAVGARRVVAVHWDDFFRPLSAPLKPFQYLADDFDATMAFLLQSSRDTGIPVELPVAWQRTDPFRRRS
jgi:L-ascorbate metabolism protein UlaG (beta-lactamase superfamily)